VVVRRRPLGHQRGAIHHVDRSSTRVAREEHPLRCERDLHGLPRARGDDHGPRAWRAVLGGTQNRLGDAVPDRRPDMTGVEGVGCDRVDVSDRRVGSVDGFPGHAIGTPVDPRPPGRVPIFGDVQKGVIRVHRGPERRGS
jgi:hypothetical protein